MPKIRKSKMTHSTPEEVKEKIDQVDKWLSGGLRPIQLRQAFAEKYGLVPRSADYYVAQVRRNAAPEGEKKYLLEAVSDRLMKHADEATRLVGPDLVEHPDYQARNDACGKLAKIWGLNAPDKVEHSGAITVDKAMEPDVSAAIELKREQSIRANTPATNLDNGGSGRVRRPSSRRSAGANGAAANGNGNGTNGNGRTPKS